MRIKALKQKFIMWLIGLLDDEYLLVRKERLNVIIGMVNRLPGSMVSTLSLIRLDGCDLKTAQKIRDNLTIKN